jgi:deazaflavin-dependent oxidoreductase (nitroreductase family)
MMTEEFTRALESSTEIQLTVTGRKSGREVSVPVWFVREGDKLYLVPVNGADSDWYKNVLKVPTIHLAVGGAEFTGRAAPVTGAASVSQIVDAFRAKYGAQSVAQYYPKPDVAVEIPLS